MHFTPNQPQLLILLLTSAALAGEPTQLWRNDTPQTNSWIIFKLQGTCSNRSAIGARITLQWATKDGSSFTTKEVSSGAGRGSFNSIPLEFGHTATALISATILWPSGTTQTLDAGDLALNAYNTITERLPADLTNDGNLNFADISAFLVAYANQDPIADFEPDGNFNFLDVSAFLAAFAAGCP